MRVIEEQMLKAVKERKGKNLGGVHPTLGVNTRVEYESGADFSSVWLFGNHIADYWHGREKPLQVNVYTLTDFPTKTTISRLRALGADIRTVKGVLYLDGYEV